MSTFRGSKEELHLLLVNGRTPDWGRVSVEEIEKNDYNLNISRYVSTAKPEEQIDLHSVHGDLMDLEETIRTATTRHNSFLKELGLPPLK